VVVPHTALFPSPQPEDPHVEVSLAARPNGLYGGHRRKGEIMTVEFYVTCDLTGDAGGPYDTAVFAEKMRSGCERFCPGRHEVEARFPLDERTMLDLLRPDE